MRLGKIQVPAYGPFTDFSLDLPKGSTDLHLIYGPNEAGKSSLLRAIRALLFGIPGQTTDNFLHDYRQLRVLAELEDANGDSHVFQRRKGNKNTLLDSDGNPAPEANLQRFLGVVDESYFDSMFGLDSEKLRHGADELLRGEGRLGEALFSASLGGTPVDRVIEALEAEAGELFSGRSRRRIRERASRHGDQLRAKKEALIKPEAWEEVEKALQEAGHRLDALRGARSQHLRRKEWLVRCRSALPLVGQLAECRAKFEALPAFPDLPGSFANEIREARSATTDATREAQRLGDEMNRLKERLEGCQLNPKALALEATIDGIHTRLGAYRENQQSLATKQADSKAKEAAIHRACQDLGISAALNDLEPLRTTQPQFADAADKAKRLREVTIAHEDATRREQDLDQALTRLRSIPIQADPQALADLKGLLAGASAIEPLATGLVARKAAVTRLKSSAVDLHGSLIGASKDLAATRAMKLPSRSTIDVFRENLDDAERALRDLDNEKRDAAKAIRNLKADIERSARQGELPGLEDLEVSRNQRERGWTLVLEDWKGGGAKETFIEGKPLEIAYPEAVAAADNIADRLRVEAEAVAQLEELRSKLKLEEENAQSIIERVQSAEAKESEIHNAWVEAWQNCLSTPASPKEMLEWRETWQEFARQWDQWTVDCEQLDADQKRVSDMCIELAKALNSDATNFQELHDQALGRYEELDKARIEAIGTQSKIQDAVSDLDAVRKQIPERQAAVGVAKQAWEKCRQALSLPEGLTPESQLETLRCRREMFQDYDAWNGLLDECETLSQRIKAYEREIDAAATTLELSAEGTETREKELWSLLGEAKNAQTHHDQLQERQTELSEECEAARTDVARTRKVFDELVTKAELGDESELDAWLTHFESHNQLRQKLDELRNGLAGLSLGSPVDKFVSNVEAEDLENLESALTELEEALAEVEEEIEDERSKHQEWEGRRKAMEAAQDQAARHDQEAAFAASTLESDAVRFVRLRVAIHLLRGQIDAFRSQNQGPFLEKASRWFSEVTGGAFSGIGTSFSDGDQPVIAGRRAGSKDEVLVSGMSEGTRDQLYLALRFAGLELHRAEHEPMPMILDDLLVHFDDARASHALAAAATLAEHSQILLFTHHAHLVELAKSHLPNDRLFFHELK